MDEESTHGVLNVNSPVFEIAASLGEARLQGMPVPRLGPTHSSVVTLQVGRGPRGVVTMGERAVIIAPLTSKTACETLLADLSNAPVDMVEWRVDLYEPFRDAPTVRERSEAIECGLAYVLENSPVPVLATIRTADEGGLIRLSEDEYVDLVRLLAAGADAVDVQIFTPVSQENVAELVHEIRSDGAVVFGSNHDFQETPSEEEILGRFYRMKTAGVDVAKVAYQVDGPADALAIMNAQMRARTLLHLPVIGIGMGGAGALTRIGGSAIGSSATFATIGGQSAPGQFTACAVREALDLLESY